MVGATVRPFQPDVAFGELIINGLSAHNYAFKVLDIRDLYKPDTMRGQSIIIPGAAGRLSRSLHVDESEHALLGYFTGVCDIGGTEHPDRWQGYETNIGLITTTWLTGDVYAASILTPSGDTLTVANGVQVLGYDVGSTANMLESPYVYNSVLRLRVPDGYFS